MSDQFIFPPIDAEAVIEGRESWATGFLFGGPTTIVEINAAKVEIVDHFCERYFDERGRKTIRRDDAEQLAWRIFHSTEKVILARANQMCERVSHEIYLAMCEDYGPGEVPPNVKAVFDKYRPESEEETSAS